MAKTRSGFWGGHQTPGGRKGERTEQGSALNSNAMTATSTFRITESRVCETKQHVDVGFEAVFVLTLFG